MTKLDHSKTIHFLVLGMLMIAATSCSQKQPSVSQRNANNQPAAKISAEQIAKAYGLDSFDQVDAIRYTWNAQFPGVNVSRSWVWEPKTNQVSYDGKDNRVEQMVYHRGGPRKPSLVTTTWEAYKKAGPLLISTDHNGNADGNQVHIFITDVAVRVAGSQNWISAQ